MSLYVVFANVTQMNWAFYICYVQLDLLLEAMENLDPSSVETQQTIVSEIFRHNTHCFRSNIVASITSIRSPHIHWSYRFCPFCAVTRIIHGLDIFLARSAAADEKSLTLGLLLKVEEMSWELDLSSEAPARHMMSPLPNTVSLPGALWLLRIRLQE